MWTMSLFKCLNLHISSKKSSAVSWQFFIWEILMTIFRNLTLKSTNDSRVLSFCSAFKGDLTVTRTSSKLGITKFESNCNPKKYLLSYWSYRNYRWKHKYLSFFILLTCLRLFFWHKAANIAPWISKVFNFGWLLKNSTKSISGNGCKVSKSPQNSIFITKCFTSLAHWRTELIAFQLHWIPLRDKCSRSTSFPVSTPYNRPVTTRIKWIS